MGLLNLPEELLFMVAEQLPTSHDILNFALTHRLLRRIGEAQLYKYLDSQAQHPDGERRFRQLIECLNKRDYLSHFTRSLTLERWVHGVTTSQIDWSINQRNQTRSSALKLKFENLKKLNIALPHNSTFLGDSRPDVYMPELEHLCVTSLPSASPSAQLPVMDLYFLHLFFQLKRLKSLDLSLFIPGKQKLLHAEHVPSNKHLVYGKSVERLDLRVGEFTPGTLRYLISKMPYLKTFSLRPNYIVEPLQQRPGLPNQPRGYTRIGLARDIVRPSTVGHILASRNNTLQSLDIRRGCGTWEDVLDRIGSLKQFYMMRSLHIPIEMLLGWNHCKHLSDENMSFGLAPEQLASLLPPSLEILELRLEDYHNHRNGPDYVYAALRSLLNDGVQAANLKKITINGQTDTDLFPYCYQCVQGSKSKPERDRMTIISLEERQAIIEAMPTNIELCFVPARSWSDQRFRDWVEVRVGNRELRANGEIWDTALRPRQMN